MSQSFILPKVTDPRQREPMLARFSSFVARLGLDKEWQITVALYRKPRSDAQNRYLWGVCYATIREATGHEAEDWHEFFLGEWGGWETIDFMGKKRMKPLRRSSKMNKMEFADYTGFIQMKAAEQGIFIPDPEPDL